MKRLACGEIMPGCQAVFTGTTTEEILGQAGQHAAEAHGLAVTPELVETVRAHIRDENDSGATDASGASGAPDFSLVLTNGSPFGTTNKLAPTLPLVVLSPGGASVI